MNKLSDIFRYILQSDKRGVVSLAEELEFVESFQYMMEVRFANKLQNNIHLSDGSAFLIFDHIEVEIPIIFTTAYNEYAINAFKVNSIDYLLKPIKNSDLERALAKFSRLSNKDLNVFLSHLNRIIPSKNLNDKILIAVQDQLIPIDLNEVAYFYTTEKSTIVHLKSENQYPYAKTLDQI